MREATTTRRVDYFRLPRPLWRKLKKHLPRQKSDNSNKRGGRPRVSDRALANAQIGTCFGRDAKGRPSTATGSESPPVSSTSVSRGGGGWDSSRS